LCGRAKKNYKTTDLMLAGLYRLLAWPSDKGNDCFILANDEAQAGDDLKLAKKLIACNPVLAGELIVGAKLIERKDGRGKLEILPAGDIVGAHGKTYSFCGFDEIHGYRNHDLFEALALDPTRDDALMWITSYAGISHAPGVPLHDFMQVGMAGDDRRMFFSWYSGDFTTDPSLADAEPEERANPSIASFTKGYLKQQRQRLPSHKFRRLHLNLPGAPDGAAFDGDKVMAAVVPGRRRLQWEEGRRYLAGVDMCGGSNDDATLSISHYDAERKVWVQDVVMSQAGKPPFNPRDAVRKFAAELKAWKITRVFGDAYGGETFRRDFEEHGIEYVVYEQRSKSDLYEALEPMLNAGEVELVDDPKQTEQLLTLVWRGSKIDHQPGNHDDFANVAAIALVLLGAVKQPMRFSPEVVARARAGRLLPIRRGIRSFAGFV
jgi:phage terminase large subunit-like protein